GKVRQDASRTHQVVLPHELVDATWPHSLGKRLTDVALLRACCEQVHRIVLTRIQRARGAIPAAPAAVQRDAQWRVARRRRSCFHWTRPDHAGALMRTKPPQVRSFCRTEYAPRAW